MNKQLEKKSLTGAQCKLSTVDDPTSDAMLFSGYGSVFGNVDWHGDIIAPGAYAKSIAQHKSNGTAPLMLFNHDAYSGTALPIGKWLDFEEDDYGLKLTGELLDTSFGRDTYTALKAGAINGLSVAFFPVSWSTGTTEDEFFRTYTDADLYEVSVVTLPANELAVVGEVKSRLADMGIRDLENLLRECGLSRKQAETVASQFESKRYLADLEEKKLADEAMALRIAKLLGKEPA
ncbi:MULTISPECIES: HK97 family phage prohead protease [unclassified Sphingobium]|uniref:HK97 family phage prohead protease n=1 Tax=unclassified Sphingobium TaxID=2611147 RepID=UPI00222457EA|nr:MULTISPECIES: HK97 family phage prohead protease [unclassified Sphingobium]MCW2412928.1 HK97 family phage prohead protease [Sphingobium sp. B8D3D]MCW2414774.1 HK97 family phage prohead protease [Sphingobium sp. B8D3A]